MHGTPNGDDFQCCSAIGLAAMPDKCRCSAAAADGAGRQLLGGKDAATVGAHRRAKATPLSAMGWARQAC